MTHRIYVVDDEPLMREGIAETLRRAGLEVETFSSGPPAIQRVEVEPPHLLITDLKLPGMDGVEVLEEARRLAPDLPVILITAHGSVENAVAAMKRGARDYIQKPFAPDELEIVVRRALEDRRLRAENEILRARLGEAAPDDFVWSGADSSRRIHDMLARVAASDATVLILGESGSGKEVAARTLHALSARRDAPFLAVNCAALTAGVLESELFGHEKGAFTGADRLRKGRFELADGGTLLLDEVSEMDPALQAKLLRVLQERAFERVGSSRPIRADVRILATSNRSLEEAIARGRFREDLYYRLNVVPVRLPPLRERREEIPALANRFLRRFAAGRRLKLAAATLDLLTRYDWPGNIRELANIVERAAVLAPGDTIPAEVVAPWLSRKAAPAAEPAGSLAGLTLEQIEERAIRLALETHGGNREKAARALGISSRTLRDKLKKYEAVKG